MKISEVIFIGVFLFMTVNSLQLRSHNQAHNDSNKTVQAQSNPTLDFLFPKKDPVPVIFDKKCRMIQERTNLSQSDQIQQSLRQDLRQARGL